MMNAALQVHLQRANYRTPLARCSAGLFDVAALPFINGRHVTQIDGNEIEVAAMALSLFSTLPPVFERNIKN